MTIFGKPLSDYIAFAKVFLVLILAAGVIRLALSLSGVPNSTTRWFTMTGLTWMGVIYLSIRVNTTGFGSYKQLLVIFALLDWAAQAVAISGIGIAIATGTNNVFSSPEFAFGGDGKTWLHLGAHLFGGTTVGALIPWGVGSAILAITRKRMRKFTNFDSTSMEQS
jgi:hypothetical protein